MEKRVRLSSHSNAGCHVCSKLSMSCPEIISPYFSSFRMPPMADRRPVLTLFVLSYAPPRRGQPPVRLAPWWRAARLGSRPTGCRAGQMLSGAKRNEAFDRRTATDGAKVVYKNEIILGHHSQNYQSNLLIPALPAIINHALL